MVSQTQYGTDDSIVQFETRMGELVEELHGINRELGRVDLLALAHRSKELLRRTKGLLDGNVAVLFHDDPERVPEELYQYIEFARGHIDKALGEECEFEIIKQRLYMATSLTEYVINGVGRAIEKLKQQGY